MAKEGPRGRRGASMLFPLFSSLLLVAAAAPAVENDDDDAFGLLSRSLSLHASRPCLLRLFFDPAATLEPFNGTSSTARLGL